VTAQSFIDKKMCESTSFDLDKAAAMITEELIPKKPKNFTNSNMKTLLSVPRDLKCNWGLKEILYFTPCYKGLTLVL
jgi:hypothetical protein